MASAATAGAAAPAHHATKVWLRGGRTTVTTGPGIATALLEHGIVPIAIAPGAESLAPSLSSPVVRLSFPVTGGRVSLSPLGGYLAHRGGILFDDLTTGKNVEVSNFVIRLRRADLTGIVNGNPKARVALFRLSFAHAHLRVRGQWVTATNIGVVLTGTAASALDSTLGTSLFTAGLPIGTASTRFRV